VLDLLDQVYNSQLPQFLTIKLSSSSGQDLLCHIFHLLSPVNLLTPTRFRMVYAFIFGAMSTSLLHLVFNDTAIKVSTDIHYLDIFFNTSEF